PMNEMRPPIRIDETALLRRTAHYARRLAPCLCNSEPARGATCDWYHGFWPTLRLLGLSTSTRHALLFQAAFGRTARDGGLKRLLIAGGADSGLLEQFAQACRNIGCNPTFGFVDRCATPVVLNRWAARRLGVRVEARQAHLLDYRKTEPFDAICCHNLLAFIDPAERAPLFKHWHSQLRPGGRLLLVSTIRDMSKLDPAEFHRDRSERLVARARARYETATIDVPRDEVLASAERFGLSLRNRHIATDQEFRDLIDPTDWAIPTLDFGPIGVKEGEMTAESGTTNSRRYAWLEAIRR
ncbi:MAG: SAM-dependent methyltransferase, partial [Kiloniellales bacterium]